MLPSGISQIQIVATSKWFQQPGVFNWICKEVTFSRCSPFNLLGWVRKVNISYLFWNFWCCFSSGGHFHTLCGYFSIVVMEVGSKLHFHALLWLILFSIVFISCGIKWVYLSQDILFGLHWTKHYNTLDTIL